MKKTLLLLALILLIGAQTAADAQELTVSDIEFIDEGYNDEEYDEEYPMIILTKEGSVLNVQLLHYSAHPDTEEFVITPKMTGGSDGEPCSVAIGVENIDDYITAVITTFNVSFNVHGIEANSFYLTCWWYKGMVSLTEGEPLELWENKNIDKDGVIYTLDNKTKTAALSMAGYVEGEYNIPEELDYEGETFLLTSIGIRAFSGNTSLTSVVIPKSITNIGGGAFYRCSNLTDLYCHAENVPTTGVNVFTESSVATATLHVPAGSIDNYKAASPWNEFGSIEALKPLVTFTKGQIATIVLPTVPDASKGMYFRIDRWEDGKIAFEQELHPQAHTPYIIVPNEDFSIDPNNLDLDGLAADRAMIEGVEFIGRYESCDVWFTESSLFFLLDTTPDCENRKDLTLLRVGSLRAYFKVLWRLSRTWEELEYVLYSADGTKIATTEKSVTYAADQMATIVLPTVPDASKGKYYRLDRCEDGQIIFEQELQPQAHIPYIIVPNEDFSIDLGTLDLAGLGNDTVSIGGISFIGSYDSETLNEPEGFYIDIIDTTPDCGFSTSAETGKEAYIGALRAYLQVSWDEPYNHGGSKSPGEKLGITLKDHSTSIGAIQNSNFKIQNDNSIYDLSGRKLSGKLTNGIYIVDGKKVAIR